MFTHIYIGEESPLTKLVDRTGREWDGDYAIITDVYADLIEEAIAAKCDVIDIYFYSDGESIVGGDPRPFRLVWEDGRVIGVEPTVIARGRCGSPPTIYGEPMKLRRVMLPDALWQKAQELGDGNGSAGIRQALESQ